MAQRPRVRRGYRIERVAGEAVYLISERGHQVLEGELVEEVVPLLDGKHDLDQILDLLPDAAPERVFFLIDRLIAADVVVRDTADLPERAAAFWDLCGATAEDATRRLSDARVELVVVGEVDPEPVRAALAALGVAVHEDTGANLRVVVTDNYLNPDLRRINEEALRTGRPWLLGRPQGSMLWVGPVFKPGVDACWACVSHRLAGHQSVDDYLQGHTGRQGPLRVPLADLPATRQLGAQFLALEAAKFLAGLDTPEENGVLTVDTIWLNTERHPLHRRPQCPACGDVTLVRKRVLAPVVLHPRPKAYSGDGGHRAKRPDEVLSRFAAQVSPVTGVIRELRALDAGLEFIKTYVAGHNFARRPKHLKQLRNGLRSQASGKGRTDSQARTGAMCEAIERYCGLYDGDEPSIIATLSELGDTAVAPNDIQRYSHRQYETRETWNAAQESAIHVVCDPLPADEPVAWTPVWSLTEERTRYVLSAGLYYHFPSQPGKTYASACSNGNAAGSSLEDAVLQGLLELVERDSVALWWYNRVRRPAFDLDSFHEPWFDEFRDVYAGVNRDVWVLDLTSDLGIPAAVAVSRRTDKPAEDILLGFGAHLDPKLAVQRALSEVNQFAHAVVNVRPDGSGYAFPDPVQMRWWRTARLAEHRYLAPAEVPPVAAGAYRDRSGPDLRDDVCTVRRVLEEHGMHVLVLDQTRPDIELPVVKVIAPGLRHFWARFGPGRLYDVPVQLGWLAEPTPEDDLNPIPMFL
jgi:bacteriocin biosynthesis cyclodehydratase domain-containing protein